MAYKFSCGELKTMNGHTIKAIEPDENGFYECVVGAVGIPTRNNVVYDTESLIQAMDDPAARFNICLKDGCLAGEYGHPVINTREDIPRLLRIDEHYISHYFGKIWIDNTPVMVNNKPGYRIKALVKPYGPYGEILRKSFEDPCHNTSFSIRSLCLPMTGPEPQYEYRKVQLVVTFDAVHAPGFEITNKRYVGNESFSEMNVDRKDLEDAIVATGMESAPMITDADIHRLYNERELRMNGALIGTNIVGDRSILDTAGTLRNAASWVYGRRK